jgi:tetratricopeptide (TPR) repeat protein
VNPNATRIRIQEEEEDLRTGKIPADKVPDTIVGIAREYSELHQHDKAISYLLRALRLKKQPDPYILNQLGIYYGEKGDFANQEKCYRESARVGSGDAPFFNLALSQFQQRKYREAQKTIEERMVSIKDGPGLTLAAKIAVALKEIDDSEKFIQEAMATFENIDSMDDWELGWFITAASITKSEDLLKDARNELLRRQSTGHTPSATGVLPEIIDTVRII